MNKIIVLGCGYIGTNLSNYIVNNFDAQVTVVGIENEYTEYLNKNVKFLPKRIEQINSEDQDMFKDAIIIDAVGNINATDDIKKSSMIFIQNCTNKIELINKFSTFKTKKYIFLSSGGTVYNDSSLPHKEDEKLDPSSIYALEKVIIENYLKILHQEIEGFNYLILRLSNPYGGITSKYKRQGIVDVAISKILNNEELDLYGKLENVRDYIYIDDISKIIYNLGVSKYKNDIFNIGSGIGISLKELFNIIEKEFDKKINYKLKPINTINIKSNVLDMSKTRKAINIYNLNSIDEGIKLIKKIILKSKK